MSDVPPAQQAGQIINAAPVRPAFDRTINLPLMLAVLGMAAAGVWWTSESSGRLGRVESTIIRMEEQIRDVTRQTIDQWRAIDQNKAAIEANERMRGAADARMEQQLDRVVNGMNAMRDTVGQLQRSMPRQLTPPQSGEADFGIQPDDIREAMLR